MEPFDSLNLTWQYLVNGLIGGLVFSLYIKETWTRCVVRMVIGAFTAGYVTHVFFHLQGPHGLDESEYGTPLSFAIGTAGFAILPLVRRAVVKFAQRGDNKGVSDE